MWNIIGHDDAVKALSAALREDRLPHALLFTGPAGIGKTTLALELAKALNCVGTDPPCGVCVHCRQTEAGNHPDVSVVERAPGKDSIVIEQVRALREAASLRPFQGRQKVYIIAGAEALTLQAADALLKTLEEPPPQVTLILTAVDAETLPATILSRCRIIPLHPVGRETLVDALVARGAARADAEHLAHLARGSVGWALGAARQPKVAAARDDLLARLSRVLDMDLDERLEIAETLTGDRKDRSALRRNVELLLLLARDLLLLKGGLPPLTVAGEGKAALRRQAERYTLQQIDAYLQGIRGAMVRIDANVDPRLALEAALVAAP